jgi:hypothetical protein
MCLGRWGVPSFKPCVIEAGGVASDEARVRLVGDILQRWLGGEPPDGAIGLAKRYQMIALATSLHRCDANLKDVLDPLEMGIGT